MGEFERSGTARGKGLGWAVLDVVTIRNFEIAAVASVIGYLLVNPCAPASSIELQLPILWQPWLLWMYCRVYFPHRAHNCIGSFVGNHVGAVGDNDPFPAA